MKTALTSPGPVAAEPGTFESKEQTTQWRQAMAEFPSGLTIVTTMDNERPSGTTVSAFCSLSLRPRLLLVCLDLRSNTLKAINETGRFAVNILSAQAQPLALKFGVKEGDKFADVDYQVGDLGCPLLSDCCANIECHVHASYIEGDHAILIGKPALIRREPAHPALVYHRGAFNA
ncbi:flavin reductase family protein [Pseudoduganella namucuonensis]|uniref:NADH-FMN oxidoreductase RutF, flavin reductase (DIM6/NTAB) family n=1 Tax=Pseudoduganella namucuonensis TaxID=1035707 RepID=A0A1I7IMA5_9BURK|nr:flavin reductase family protein [Pseudoduganella namucuonensis]SFU74047.1 NADH-FMN oxidoreductase RutF, flavin reductase (DIM6/NTAB) family [Pseudoduganella namucuonensis]